MPGNRALRVAEQIKKEVSRIIREEIKDPRIAAITSVTGVELSRDLRYASVYVSIYDECGKQDETLQTLHRASGFIRSEMGRRIRLRHTPEITFHHDHSMEYGARIDRVIKKLQSGNSEG